jgi:hypothetical protein
LQNKFSFGSLRYLFIISVFLLQGLRSEAQSLRPLPSPASEPKFKIYPNPATSYIQVEWAADIKPFKIVIANGITGRELHYPVTGSSPMRVNLGDYAPGLYVFKLISNREAYINSTTFRVFK